MSTRESSSLAGLAGLVLSAWLVVGSAEAQDSAGPPAPPAVLRPTVSPEQPALEPYGPPVPPELTAQGPKPELVQPLRLGILAGRDAADSLRGLSGFADGLAKAIGRPVELVPMALYGAMIDAQTTARIDGGFFSATAFAMAQFGCSCVEPLVAPAASDGTTGYHAVLVTPADSRIEDLNGLRGKSLALAAADSVAGRWVPLAALLAEGIEVDALFSTIRNAGSYERAIQLAIAGEVDVAVAWTSMAGEVGRGYSRGTLTDLVGRGEIDPDEIKLIWRSPLVMHGPFAVSSALPPDDKTAIEAFLLGLETSDPVAYDILNPLYAGGYLPVNPEDYAELTALMEQDVDAVRVGGVGQAVVDQPSANRPDVKQPVDQP